MPFSSIFLVDKEWLLPTGTGLRRIVDFATQLPESRFRSLFAYPRDTGLRGILYVAKGDGLATGETFIV